MSISFKHLRYFLAAAETSQFSTAAERVHVSQTAITVAMRELEHRLGRKLFERHHSTGVSLTAHGEGFVRHAREVLEALERAMGAGRGGQAAAGRIRVAAPHTAFAYYVAPALCRFRKSYPNVQVEMVELAAGPCVDAVLAGDAEAAFVWLFDGSLPKLVAGAKARKAQQAARDMITLARSRRQLWLPSGHPLLAQRDITLADIAPLPYVLYDVDLVEQTTLSYFNAARLSPNIVLRTGAIEAVRSFIANGDAVTILSDVAYRPWSMDGQKIEARPIAEGVPPVAVGLLTDPAQAENTVLDLFRDFMQTTFSGPGLGIRVS
jgi:DNA-binding transcriptional LysR family regulator